MEKRLQGISKQTALILGGVSFLGFIYANYMLTAGAIIKGALAGLFIAFAVLLLYKGFTGMTIQQKMDQKKGKKNK